MQRLGQSVARWSERWVPSPFIFAIGLTLIAYVAALAFTSDGPLANIVNWYDGFWTLLEFAMQMVLILVTGYAVADSEQVSGLLDRIASIPDTGSQAAALVAAVAMGAGYFHWGVGLIVGAIFAVFVARAGRERGKTFHYPLLCAAGYTSQVIWHVGPSTSAGLLSATEGHVFEDVIGVVPLSESAFTLYAFGLAVMVFLTVVPLMYYLAPEPDHAVGIEEYAPELLDGPDTEPRSDGGETVARTPSERLNESRLIAYLVGTGMFVYVLQHFATAGLGEALDLNVFNFAFIAAGLFLYGTPTAYMGAIRNATESSAGIILQFPFYAGILGIISNSGLSDLIAAFLLDVATPATFPVVAWLLGGVMNIFVPSGGGEWGIIGGIVGGTAVELGVEPGQAIIAYGAGDMWTNMFQPFWAIPLLGITRMDARDILGYTLIVMVALAPVIAVGLYFLPY
ncbi:short chain fatty acids transporter [Halalkalicoccus jeotgali B3]|uniref:Short chain fatty acids transporter n=1 Tax=Halalkalicoccus jeotgali (strain DSM 18796 / CECT 7217 / JCM 14584 / KCTC 4019 / B3) TaxID=795797 RepID=D8JAR5_HALJB|nr:short chain fatty acids transporter [Halalkalicoccus jeotgali B3]ELY39369.1 short chain fatty acids transporter [Halalkalicoccus jeotgali B3]